MIKWLNTPLDDIIQSAINVYGDIDCNIVITQGLVEEQNAYGITSWQEDGTATIHLDASISYEAVMETLTHELAHVIVGIKNEHNEIWQECCDNIHKEYDRYGSKKYGE